MNDKEKKEFYTTHVFGLRNEIYRIIVSVIKDGVVAEDITQTVFEKAWHKLDTLKDRDKAKQWVKSIARNEIRNHLKKRDSNKEFSEEVGIIEHISDDQINRAEKDILEALLEKEHYKHVLEALEMLDEKSKEIIRLHLIMELPLKQIAEDMGLNYGSTRVFYARAIKKLRDVTSIIEEE